MKSTVVEQFRVDGMTILEWYDGVVRAVVTQQGSSYLLTLVAWDVDSQRKIFILTNLTKPFEDAIERLVQETEDEKIKAERWDEFNRSFDEYLSSYQEKAYLIFAEPTVGSDFSATTISSEYIRQIKNYSIESAVAPEAISFWFELADEV
jgi:hypothetical protein